jgi:hypothetical protein
MTAGGSKPKQANTRKPEFRYGTFLFKIEANGEVACKWAFFVALIIALGRYFVLPLVVLVIALFNSNLSMLGPILRQLALIP